MVTTIMMLAPDDDRAEEAYAVMQSALEEGEFPASDVVYALGMMIAVAIREHAIDKNPERTLKLIGDVVRLELQKPKQIYDA